MHEQNSVEFMGVLVDRQYTTGQKYAQLVFETAEGIRLSLSRNINMVKSLRLGLTYKVKGPEHTVGQKRYIHEPTATLVSSNKLASISKRYKIYIIVAVSLGIVLSGVGVLAYTTRNSDATSSPTAHKNQSVSTSKPVTTQSAPISSEPASETTTPATTPQQVSPVPVRPAQKNTAPSPTPPVNPVINNTVTTPVTNDTTNSSSSQDNSSTTPVTDQPTAETPTDTQTQTPVEQPDPTPVINP